MGRGDGRTRASGSQVRAGSVSDGGPAPAGARAQFGRHRRSDARHGPWTSLTLPALLARGAWLLSRTNSATSKLPLRACIIYAASPESVNPNRSDFEQRPKTQRTK